MPWFVQRHGATRQKTAVAVHYFMEACTNMHGPATKKLPASAFPQRMPRENTILVTVGSTRFDALVYKAVSESFLACVCRALGPQAEVWIQYGHSACALPSGAKKGTLRNTEGVWIDTQGLSLIHI